MTSSRRDQLHSDIGRWRGRLPTAESTYCQGVANKAAKEFEAILKLLMERRLAITGSNLRSLLREVKYGGGVETIEKLPLGTVTQVVLALSKHDEELASLGAPSIRNALTRIVEVRNETTHELDADRMRAATETLLDLIESVVRGDAFADM